MIYAVVSPLGEPDAGKRFSASPLPNLEGKKVGFVWTLFTQGDVLAEALMDVLGEKVSGFEGVKLPSGKGAPWGAYPNEGIKDLVRETAVDAVVVTVGG